MLNLTKSFEKLEKFPLANYKVIKSEQDLDFDYPFFLKASDVLHKTEEQAVLKSRNEKEAIKNFKQLQKQFPESDIIMQEGVEGIEMIIGIKTDPVFEKLLLIGFGGIHTETIKDISFRALPIDRTEIFKMIKELKLFPTLTKRKKYALDKFIKIVEKASTLDVTEMDLNPVIINEDDAVVVDARIEL